MSDLVPVAPNDKWKPIDTAPMDGSVITVGVADGSTWIVSKGVWELPKARWFSWCSKQPTHWLPDQAAPVTPATPEETACQVDMLRIRSTLISLCYKQFTQPPCLEFLQWLQKNPDDIAFPERYQEWAKYVDEEFPLMLKEMP